MPARTPTTVHSTILNGENVPGGLQVLAKDGHWIDVETEPETFVVNIDNTYALDQRPLGFQRSPGGKPAGIDRVAGKAPVHRVLSATQLRRADRMHRPVGQGQISAGEVG